MLSSIRAWRVTEDISRERCVARLIVVAVVDDRLGDGAQHGDRSADLVGGGRDRAAQLADVLVGESQVDQQRVAGAPQRRLHADAAEVASNEARRRAG